MRQVVVVRETVERAYEINTDLSGHQLQALRMEMLQADPRRVRTLDSLLGQPLSTVSAPDFGAALAELRDVSAYEVYERGLLVEEGEKGNIRRGR